MKLKFFFLVSTLDSVEWRVDYLLGSSALQVTNAMLVILLDKYKELLVKSE